MATNPTQAAKTVEEMIKFAFPLYHEDGRTMHWRDLHKDQQLDIIEQVEQYARQQTAPLEQRIKQAKWDMMNVIEDKTDLHDAIRVNGVDGVYIHEKYIHALFETLLPTPPGERREG